MLSKTTLTVFINDTSNLMVSCALSWQLSYCVFVNLALRTVDGKFQMVKIILVPLIKVWVEATEFYY